jgi:hypothetical protein
MEWNKVRITATGVVPNLKAGSVYGGIVTQAVGTTTTLTVYDDTSAVTASLITPVTATATTNVAGAFSGPIGSGVSAITAVPPMNVGLTLERGLYVVIGGTGSPTFWVLYK